MNPDDPRARRTRTRLRAAVLELAADRDLTAVTMAEVARRASVNRATIYAHYRDQDELLTDAMEEAVAEVAHAAGLCPLDAPATRAPQPLVDLFAHVARNATLYRRMLGAQGSARFATRLRDRLAEELGNRFRGGARPPGLDVVPVDVHASYLAGALVAVIAHWVAQPDRPSVAEISLATWRLLCR
ncbi:TetR/AcrR family transcriptional regulator [Micromonospora sp. NPDC003197]